MQNEIIASVVDRFPYLSADVCEPRKADHPQLTYADCNKVDETQVAKFSKELDQVAVGWASLNTPDTDSSFIRAVCNLRTMLDAVSATSMMVLHNGELIVERPGSEIEKSVRKNRRKEITALSETMLADWSAQSYEDKLSFARIAVLGIAPLQVELVNYLDTSAIPTLVGRMLSRLDQISGKQECENVGAVAALQNFFEIERRTLEDAGLARIGIPVGTRPRVYVPQEALTIDTEVKLAATEVLQHGSNRVDSIVKFLSMVWKDFADEGFMVLHEGNEVNAYALVGGCVYHYHADIDLAAEPPTVKGEGNPQFVATAGDYNPTGWRRTFDSLCFDNGTEGLIDFRKNVITLEALPVSEREIEGRSGYLATAAQKLLNRQINYNISHVLRGQMERISTEEWSPNMCRDQYGLIYNPAHALGGVGEMFRGLLQYGGRSSQFRTWRERDGTHGFEAMRRFLGYKAALDQFLLTPKAG